MDVLGFPGGASGKNPPANAGDMTLGFPSWAGKLPERRAWQPTSVFLPGESHGHRSLVGYSSWGCKSWIRLKQLGKHKCGCSSGEETAMMRAHSHVLFLGALEE